MTTRKPARRNALYAMLAAYLKNYPDTKPAQAWAHFAGLARDGLVPALVAFDGHAIEIQPDPERTRTRLVGRLAFARQLQKIRRELFARSS